MMTEKYIKAVAEGKASDLLEKQREIAGRHYNGGTGRLFAAMSIVAMMRGNRLGLNYPLHIRYLDLSRTATGKRKKITMKYTIDMSTDICIPESMCV